MTDTKVFTDEDLEQLKEVINSMDGKFESWNFVEKDGAAIKALIARLEAAERVLGDNCPDENTECELCLIHHKEYMLWRKLAGK